MAIYCLVLVQLIGKRMNNTSMGILRTTIYAVVHRLCIHPEYQNHKIGYQAMMIIEHSLKENGISSIRLDAFSENPFSLKMYEKLGYKNVGIAEWRKRDLLFI